MNIIGDMPPLYEKCVWYKTCRTAVITFFSCKHAKIETRLEKLDLTLLSKFFSKLHMDFKVTLADSWLLPQ